MDKTTQNTALMVSERNTAGERKRLSFFSAAKQKYKHLALMLTIMFVMNAATAISAFAAAPGGTTGTSAPATDEGTQMFNQVIGFFALWIGRIGLVVGFIGAIMFGLAIKNEDADAKTRGLMTMASGFVVFAVTKALNLFGIVTT